MTTQPRLWGALLGLGILGLGGLGCDRPAPSPKLQVMAASSLMDVLPEVGAAWTQGTEIEIVFSFDSTSRLAMQVKAGAPGDVFISANPMWMTDLEASGALKPSSKRDLLSNSLVFITPTDSSQGLTSFEGLSSEDNRLGLAGETVPAGMYARQSLKALGLWETLRPQVVVGDTVRSVLHWVARGEVNGGIVYETDAKIEPRVRVAFALPRETHDPIRYPGAVLAESPLPDAALSFLRYCQCDAAPLFKARGFEPLGGECNDSR